MQTLGNMCTHVFFLVLCLPISHTKCLKNRAECWPFLNAVLGLTVDIVEFCMLETGRNAGIGYCPGFYRWNSGVLHTDNREEYWPFLRKDCGILFLLPNARQ